MSTTIPSSSARPRLVNQSGYVLDQEYIDSVRELAELPSDLQIFRKIPQYELNYLVNSAMNRLYDFEKDESLPWLALILDQLALSTYEIAHRPRPDKQIKIRRNKSKVTNEEDANLLRDIHDLRASLRFDCSMEDQTRRVCSLDAGSVAGRLDLKLIGLECDLSAEGRALDLETPDFLVDLPRSVIFLCQSIRKHYTRNSGTKSTLIEKMQPYRFDICAVLHNRPVKYSTVRNFHNGLQRFYMALREGDDRINDVRESILSIDTEHGQNS